MKTFVIGDVHGRRAQLRRLVEMLPRDMEQDTLVLLGDLIDRGEDAPGVVSDVLELKQAAPPDRVVVLRGNHEQMLLDFLDGVSTLWLHEVAGGEHTLEQYGVALPEDYLSPDLEAADETLRETAQAQIPAAHQEFFRRLPFYYEDDYAIYVHAGLEGGKHPREMSQAHLLWSRDEDFFRRYTGKPCIFGHTPVPFLPLRGRLGRHGIYISHSAIGIDSGYTHDCPLSCIELPAFVLRQAFADGRTATHRITAFVPPALRALQAEELR